MLFNSASFLLVFLPVAWVGFVLISASGRARPALFWLLACSITFYAWWDWRYTPLLVGSIAVNLAFGRLLARRPDPKILAAAIAINVATLGYFKYAGFAVSGTNDIIGSDFAVPVIALPLAISFFTFQQIAYLVAARDGQSRDEDWLRYGVFVSFFPQLIAGPIVQHREMAPQLARSGPLTPAMRDVACGATVFAIGLWKKVMVADNIAIVANAGFSAAEAGLPMGMVEAWTVAVAYALQIYFDFSGYSDMAIGLALMFGFRLPINFDSPYKAKGIIEYWSRWHITLTRFLTGHIYNPIVLALTRRRARRGGGVLRPRRPPLANFMLLLAGPTILTMFISGLWHGAGWQFIVFGLLHGVYLAINHAWRMYGDALPFRRWMWAPARNALSLLLTFAAVVVALVFFRAESVSHALLLLGPMFGAEGPGVPWAFAQLFGPAAPMLKSASVFADWQVADNKTLALVVVLLAAVWLLPNTQQWMAAAGQRIGVDREPALAPIQATKPWRPLSWRPSLGFGMAFGCVFSVVLLKAVSEAPTEFIYFNF